jgi:hypothetical protein
MSVEDREEHMKPKNGRNPYERPQLSRLRLEPDQVLVTGCKMIHVTTQMHSGLPNCGFAAKCSGVGT